MFRTSSLALLALRTTEDEGGKDVGSGVKPTDLNHPHYNLHKDLYGDEDGADVHGLGTGEEMDRNGSAEFFAGGDNGDDVVLKYAEAVEVAEVRQGDGRKISAVYAVSEDSGDRFWEGVRHVGITRNLGRELRGHLANPNREKFCRFAKVREFKFPKREPMSALMSEWLENCVDGEARERWSSNRAAAMTEVEKGDYQKNKEKLVRAMGVPAEGAERQLSEEEEKIRIMRAAGYLDSEDDEDDEDEDDWTTEIEQQSLPTMMGGVSAPPYGNAPTAPPPSAPVSPTPPPSLMHFDDSPLPFNFENVDKVLDDCRPYLQADGGDVKLHSIEEDTKSINVVLTGACGTCPSATVTMKMLLERVLKERFPGLGPVTQLEGALPSDGDDGNLRQAVEESLSGLMPAISAMGGSVRVQDVNENGVVQLSFRGANKLKLGIELAIRDLPYVKHVEFV